MTRGMPKARTEERLEAVLCRCYHYYELVCQNLSERSDSRHLDLLVPHLTILKMYFFLDELLAYIKVFHFIQILYPLITDDYRLFSIHKEKSRETPF